MSAKKIFIITVNWNGKKDSIELLTSLKKLVLPRQWKVKVMLVDNGSTDGSVRVIFKRFPRVRVIEMEENLGFAGGFNQGMKLAIRDKADYLLLINNDTLIEDCNLLKKLIGVAEKNEKIGIVVPKIHFAPGFEYHRKRYQKSEIGRVIWYAGGHIDWQNVFIKHRGVDEVDKGQYDCLEEVDFATGCVMLINSEVIEKVGVFREEYFAYFEDADFNLRVKSAGFKLMYNGLTSIWHKTAQASGGSGAPFHDYFLTRNRLLFGLRYAPLKTKIALLKEAARLVQLGRRFQKLAVKDYFLKKWGKGRYFSQQPD